MLGEDLWFRIKKKERKGILWKYLKLKRNKKCTFGRMFRECWRKYTENRQMSKLPWVCECKGSTFWEFVILLQIMEMYAVSVLISQNIILQELLFWYCGSVCGPSKLKLCWWLRDSFLFVWNLCGFSIGGQQRSGGAEGLDHREGAVSCDKPRDLTGRPLK